MSKQFTDEELLQLNQKKPSPSAPILPKNDSTAMATTTTTTTTAQVSKTQGFNKNNNNNNDKGILKTNLKGNKFNQVESQKKALENLDQMVKSIYDTDIPGMCFMPPPPNSKSEGNIGYLQGACK